MPPIATLLRINRLAAMPLASAGRHVPHPNSPPKMNAANTTPRNGASEDIVPETASGNLSGESASPKNGTKSRRCRDRQRCCHRQAQDTEDHPKPNAPAKAEPLPPQQVRVHHRSRHQSTRSALPVTSRNPSSSEAPDGVISVR